MHPVTAHGFNFGLRGAFALGREVLAAQPGEPRYWRQPGPHAATSAIIDARRLPLFAATNAIAALR
jgi:2-polyprenyl-6-methoxyphenol hydroxylase-like FAD-dependent oxidoreductase